MFFIKDHLERLQVSITEDASEAFLEVEEYRGRISDDIHNRIQDAFATGLSRSTGVPPVFYVLTRGRPARAS
jgi:hypothetical protein